MKIRALLGDIAVGRATLTETQPEQTYHNPKDPVETKAGRWCAGGVCRSPRCNGPSP